MTTDSEKLTFMVYDDFKVDLSDIAYIELHLKNGSARSLKFDTTPSLLNSLSYTTKDKISAIVAPKHFYPDLERFALNPKYQHLVSYQPYQRILN